MVLSMPMLPYQVELEIHILAAFFIYIHTMYASKLRPCADPEEGGGQGIRTLMKNHKNIGVLSKTGPDPLKITKLSSQHSMLSHHRHASKTQF